MRGDEREVRACVASTSSLAQLAGRLMCSNAVKASARPSGEAAVRVLLGGGRGSLALGHAAAAAIWPDGPGHRQLAAAVAGAVFAL